MIQLFIKPSKIHQSNWEIAYERIKSIVLNFPTKLIRKEHHSYYYESKLSTIHFDLIQNEHTNKEYIAFSGDWMSYSSGQNVVFYKSWENQLKLRSFGEEIDINKPITWHNDSIFINDGSLIEANGIHLSSGNYYEIENSSYRLTMIAIGIMLENMFQGAAFLTVYDNADHNDIDALIYWLNVHFDESFNCSIYFDKDILLESLKMSYENEIDIINRLAHLYRNKHLNNMTFAIEKIGYEPTFKFYTHVLANNGFGTLGFSNVLGPWIAATQSLEATLNLISAAKNYHYMNIENEKSLKEYNEYDFCEILQQLLSEFILLTPLQREVLKHFHTNEKALHGENENIFETMLLLTGNRVDICPVYADKDELFEAFMYHDPKNGKKYLEIIEQWINDNIPKLNKLNGFVNKTIENMSINYDNMAESNHKNDETKLLQQKTLNKDFISGFKPHEQYIISDALDLNPLFPQAEDAVIKFKKRIITLIKNCKDETYIDYVKTLSKKENISYIKNRINDVGYTVNPEFEKWIDSIDNNQILFYLHFSVAIKLYNWDDHFSRFLFLFDKKNWENWDILDD